MNVGFILQGKEIIPCGDSRQLEQFFQNPERIIARSRIGKFEVSTVFLCINHNFFNHPSPILFETMIFYKKNGKKLMSTLDYQTRCATYDQALDMHEMGCKKVADLLKQKKVQWKTKSVKPFDE